MSKKVIYISWVKLTDKYASDYFINHLIESRVEVEWWDVVAFTREQHNEVGELDVDYLRVLQTYSDFESLVKLNENKDVIYIPLMNFQSEVRSIYQLLGKYRCKMVFLSWGEMPATAGPVLHRAAIKLIKQPSSFFRIVFEVFFLISYKKLGLLKPYDLIFVAGSVMINSNKFVKKTIQLNSPDYDHYMRLKKSDNKFCHEKYAVFLDLNMPYHSDLALDGLTTVHPSDYYQSLNRFFSFIEGQYGVKIIIAAHPKTDPNKDVFEGREIYRLITAEIVKDAEFVITHHSTSLNYAVLNSKPCVFIYTNEMEELYANTRVKEIKTLASYIDAPVYNIDKLTSADKIVVNQPNHARYDDYKYSFLTSKEAENLSSYDIFLQGINQN